MFSNCYVTIIVEDGLLPTDSLQAKLKDKFQSMSKLSIFSNFSIDDSNRPQHCFMRRDTSLTHTSMLVMSETIFITNILLHYPKALQYAPLEYRNNPKIVLDAVRHYDSCLEYVGNELLNDLNFALRLVNDRGLYYRYLPEHVKRDRHVAQQAILQNGHVYSFLPQEFKTDKELLILAMKTNSHAISYAHPKLQSEMKGESKPFNSTTRTIESKNRDFHEIKRLTP